MNQQTQNDPAALRAAWDQLREQQPALRIRDAAARLGVSEAELLATGVGAGVTRLEGDFTEMVKMLPELGEIMALTRNDHAVHERRGVYEDVSAEGAMGLVLGEDIDLRLFFAHWRFGFAVSEQIRGEERVSLHFFDADGTAIHKVYLQSDGNREGYDRFVRRFTAAEQSGHVAVEPIDPPPAPTPDDEIDYDALYARWRALEDTHQFFGMLREFKVGRVQALRNAPSDLATELDALSLRRVLTDAASSGLPIMIFVGSPGVIQIHTGPVERIVPMGPWINVLDKRFNLHLREDAIASAWVVRKHTTDGVVTALELFDRDGDAIALLFGKRKPGKPESEGWRELVAAMEQDHALMRAV
jgi:putative hemin transport protein